MCCGNCPPRSGLTGTSRPSSTRPVDLLESELERHLAAAHDEQDRLSELLGTDPVARPVGWPLRGELISHLDRFRTELEAGKPDSRPRRRRNRAWRAACDALDQRLRSVVVHFRTWASCTARAVASWAATLSRKLLAPGRSKVRETGTVSYRDGSS